MDEDELDISAHANKGGRSLDLDLFGGIPLTRIRMEASMDPAQHQVLVRRMVAAWNIHRHEPLAQLEAQAAELEVQDQAPAVAR